MQSLLRRLKYYGIGFGFGLLFVIFFFKNRGCTWLPSNRVKNSVQERLLVLPEDQEACLKQKGLSVKAILDIIEKGDVDFSESRKHSNPKVYLFEGSIDNGQEIKFYVTLPLESFVSEVHLKESSISKVKNTKVGTGKFISFPKDRQLLYIDSTDVLEKQKKKLGIANSEKLLNWVKKSGKIDFSKTNFHVKPKAEHLISYKDEKGREIELKAVWYKEKINVVAINLADTSLRD
jgi:hypothetical protein